MCGKLLRVCAHLEAREEGTQRSGQLAERSSHVGRRRRRVRVKKALERRRNPREVAFSSTLLLTLFHWLKTRGGLSLAPPGQSSELMMGRISGGELRNLTPGLLHGKDLSLLVFRSSGGWGGWI